MGTRIAKQDLTWQDDPPIAVFTDHGDPLKFVPYRHSTGSDSGRWRFGRAWIHALSLWRSARRHHGVGVFVTFGTATGFALAGLQTLARPWIAPRTHVMFGLLLEHLRRGPAGWFHRLKMAAFRSSGVRAVVWGRSDPDTYALEHGIPRDRLQWHPYHATLDGFAFEVRDDGYVFAGGNQARDYRTVIEALAEVEYPVIIATSNPDIPALAKPHRHMSVRGVTPAEFRQLMAGCTLFVEAHPADFPRTAGHQTMLNAMAMGKPLVLADEPSAAGYFEHGVEGFVVPAGKAQALREYVQTLLEDPDLRRRFGEAGRRRLRNPIYTTLGHMQSIYNLALYYEQERISPGKPKRFIELYGPWEAGIPPAMSP